MLGGCLPATIALDIHPDMVKKEEMGDNLL